MGTYTASRLYAGRKPAPRARTRGNWKLAYADFLTALAAFFLMMWMVSGASSSSRVEIAAYFRGEPPARHAVQSAALTLAPTETTATLERLYAALTLNEPLRAAGDSLILTQSPDGLRIDLVDRDGHALFATGAGDLTPEGQRLASAVGTVLAAYPVRLAIEGHTDAFSGAGDAFSNWDLSAARAMKARQALTQAGLPPSHILAVTGLADTVPLVPGEPHLAANRRISLRIGLPDTVISAPSS